jgi:ArsR family transcriptional regulator
VFDSMSTLREPLRCRILLLLEGQELTVSELCAVLQMPQSSVSRHLKALDEGGWVVARREGTSRLYLANAVALSGPDRELWALVREQVMATTAVDQDRQRLASILAQRLSRSQEFFASAADRWSAVRSELFGQRFDLEGLVGLLDARWVVGDLGCGTGQTSSTLAPWVHRVIAVDESEAMLDTARSRLQAMLNVDLRRGRLEALPVGNGELDVAILMLVLHHVAEPRLAIGEAMRALKPGGRLLVVDMLPHQREEYRQQMGHLWLGFAETQMRGWFEELGLKAVRFHPVPADPDAAGPALFAASARQPLKKALPVPEPEAIGA